MSTKIPFVERASRAIARESGVAFSIFEQNHVRMIWPKLLTDAQKNIAAWRMFIRSRGKWKFQNEYRMIRSSLDSGTAYLIQEAMREEGMFATYRGYMAPGVRKNAKPKPKTRSVAEDAEAFGRMRALR